MSAGMRGHLLPWLLGALALSLVLALWIWFDRCFEKRTQAVKTDWSAAARRNPFLAAERFLRRTGVEVESVPGRELLRDLPPPGDMLVVNGLDALNRERRERLHAWLEQGGGLLLKATRRLAPGEAPRPDDFPAGFGALLRVAADVEQEPAEAIAEIDFVAFPEPVRVGFVPRYYLEDAEARAVATVLADGRPRLLQYRVGEGLLTVTSDNVFLTNAGIGNHDHALALALMSLNAGKVWLIYDHAAPGLARLLWRTAPQAIVAVAILVAAVLWHLGARIGPRLPAPTRARRNLIDHLEAAAALLPRYGRGGLLLEVTSRRVEQAWLRRHPLLHELDRDGRAGWIGAQIGVDARGVYAALYLHDGNDRDFLARSRLLQRLWSAL